MDTKLPYPCIKHKQSRYTSYHILYPLEAYQAVVTQTSKHHYIYQDAATYCKLGHVRYSMKLAESDHYPVTREFAADVCSLPVTYDANSYMQFIEKWGTVINPRLIIKKSYTIFYTCIYLHFEIGLCRTIIK
jgi:hypothetical protein